MSIKPAHLASYAQPRYPASDISLRDPPIDRFAICSQAQFPLRILTMCLSLHRLNLQLQSAFRLRDNVISLKGEG
jgi:hypothetical protein